MQEDFSEGALRLGQLVHHAYFGEGVVLSVDGVGPRARVIVHFKKYGKKQLMAGPANLVPVV
jgi:DNA helicase-2/ATP-dependent DNA helicase PcrA